MKSCNIHVVNDNDNDNDSNMGKIETDAIREVRAECKQ